MKPWILVFSIGGWACTHREPLAPQIPSFSAPSESFSAYSAPQVSTSPVLIQADLIVRPDTVCFPISIEARDTTGTSALAAAKETLARLKAATKSKVRVDDISTRVTQDEVAPAWVTVRAVIERSLPDADAFERAAVVAEMADALQPFHQAASKVTRPEPKVPLIGIGAPSPGLEDIEQHRQKLLDGWASRVKALAKTTDDSTITLVNCSAPGEVRVTGGTLEQIGLSLPIQCTIGVQPRGK